MHSAPTDSRLFSNFTAAAAVLNAHSECVIKHTHSARSFTSSSLLVQYFFIRTPSS